MIPTRERCQMCHRVSTVGFHVPNEIWLAVVYPHWQASILCIACFTSLADEKLIAWDDGITFYPASLRAHLSWMQSIETAKESRSNASGILSDAQRQALEIVDSLPATPSPGSAEQLT